MSWLFSQVLVEEYLAANSLDGEQSAPLNGKPTQQAYCAPDKMTAFSRLSRFGMTYKPLTESLGVELLTLYLADFHARTLAQQEKAQELMENDQECGEKWLASFVKYDQDSSLWRTHQCSLLGDLDEFLETWPQWGLMRDGECWEQKTLEQSIRGTEFGLSLLPTPTASMMPCEGTVRIMRKAWESGEFTLEEASAVAGRDVRKSQGKVQAWPTPVCQDSRHATTRHLDPNNHHWKSNLGEVVMSLEQPNIGGRLNPTWVEWLMGWPQEWTDLKPLEMDKCHCAPQQHGESSQKDN
jgi:hypothetical protein